ncbi:hypothetical protein KEM52_006116 [Ascosphaera acerosa]|nr:hypothetical protein KEM52_006116 [Ascosphaera acerosa]
MATMRAVGIKDGQGPAAALYIDEHAPRPVPGPGEALVRVKAFGINRMDLLQREGKYPVPPGASPVLGVEFSGVVEEVATQGEGEATVGDEVFGLASGGAYAEYVAVPARMLIRKPACLSWVQAASIPEAWLTALQAMYLIGRFHTGKSILWHAGASGVSIAGIQLSAAGGAGAIYVTAGSDAKVAFCVDELGATAGWNYRAAAAGATARQDGWAQGVLAATGGRGVDTIVDFVGAPYFAANLRAAAVDGTIANLALLGGARVEDGAGGVDISPFLRKRLRFEGSTLRSRSLEYQCALRELFVARALPGIEAGRFRLLVERVFAMEDVAEAHRLMESNQTRGKIVCTVGG